MGEPYGRQGGGKVGQKGKGGIKGQALESPLSGGSGGVRGTKGMQLFALGTPLAGGARKEGMRRVEGALECREGEVVREIVWGRPGRFGWGWARKEHRWAKEETVEEEAETTELIEGTREEGDVLGVEVGNQESCVDLRGTTTEFVTSTCIVCSKKGVGGWELRGYKCWRRGRRRRDCDVERKVAGGDGGVGW